MRAGDLLHWNNATPFVPYRLRMNSGRTFDVRHPEMVKIGRSQVMISSYIGDATDIHERMDMVGLLLIEGIEPITAPPRLNSRRAAELTPALGFL